MESERGDRGIIADRKAWRDHHPEIRYEPAYIVMTALAWDLKAWFALSVPEHPRHVAAHREQERGLLRMEFKRFVNTIILMPCQIVKGGHRLIYRLLSWNEWQGVFLRVVHALRC